MNLRDCDLKVYRIGYSFAMRHYTSESDSSNSYTTPEKADALVIAPSEDLARAAFKFRNGSDGIESITVVGDVHTIVGT